MNIVDDPRVHAGVLHALSTTAWATACLHPLFQKNFVPSVAIYSAIVHRDKEWRPGAGKLENFAYRASVLTLKCYFLSRAIRCWPGRATMTLSQKAQIFGAAGIVAGLDWLRYVGMTHYKMRQKQRPEMPRILSLNVPLIRATLHPVFLTRVLPVYTLAVAWYNRDPSESTEMQVKNAVFNAALFCLPALAIRHALCKWPMRDAMSYSQQMLVFGGATIVTLAPPARHIHQILKAKGVRKETAAAPAGGF